MPSDNRALWVDDNDVLHCRNCNAAFSFFRRKHHCRLCGQIFCSTCIVNLNQSSLFPWATASSNRDLGAALPSSLGKVCIHCYDRQVQQQQQQQRPPPPTDEETTSAKRWGAGASASSKKEAKDSALVRSPIFHSPLSSGKGVLPMPTATPPELRAVLKTPSPAEKPEPMLTTTMPESIKSHVGRETPPLPPDRDTSSLSTFPPSRESPSPQDKTAKHAGNGRESEEEEEEEELLWALEDPPVKVSQPPQHFLRGKGPTLVRAKPSVLTREASPPFARPQQHKDAAPVGYEYYKKEQLKAKLLFPTTFIKNNYATNVDERMLRSMWEHVSSLASARAAHLVPDDSVPSARQWKSLFLSNAWEAVAKTVVPVGRFPQEHIMVLWEQAAGEQPRSDVVDGIVLRQLLLSKRMRTHLYNPKVLLVSGDLSYYSASDGNSVRVVNGYKGYLNSLWHRIQRWAPDLLLVEGDMHHYLQSTIINYGHMCVVTNVGATMLRRVAAAAQATIIKDLDYTNEVDLLRTDIMGTVKEFKQVRVQDGTLRTILRGFEVPLYSTIVLQGSAADERVAQNLVQAQLATVVTLFHLTLLAHVQMDFGIGMWVAAAPLKKTEPAASRLWQSELTYNGDQVEFTEAGADSSSFRSGETADAVTNRLTLRKVRLELKERPPSSVVVEENLSKRTYYTEHAVDTYAFYEDGSDTALASFFMQAVKEEHLHFLYAHGHTKVRLTKCVCGADDRSKAYYCKGAPDAVECFSRAWRYGRYGPQSSAQMRKPTMSPPYCYSCCSNCEERRRNGETLAVSLCSPFTLNMSMGAFLEYLCYASHVTACPLCGGALASSEQPQLGCARLTFCFVFFPFSETLTRVEIRFHVTLLQRYAIHYPAVGDLTITTTNNSNGNSTCEARQDEKTALLEGANDCCVTSEKERIYTSEPTSVLRAVLLKERTRRSPSASIKEKLSCLTANMPGAAVSGGAASSSSSSSSSFINTHTLHAVPIQAQGVREITYTVDVLYGDAFFSLRQLLSGDPQDEKLLASLARCNVFRAEGGKASADFYCTHDRKLLLKLVKSAELYHISSMGPAYFRYLAQCLSEALEDPHAPKPAATALVPLLGLYVVKTVFTQSDNSTIHQEPRHFLLMENIRSRISPAHRVDQVYDLKGSQRNRVAPKGSNVRLDVDFVYETLKGNFFFCSTADKMHAMRTLRADSKFLQSCTVTDYSLCVLLATCTRPNCTAEAERHIWLGIIDYLHPYNGAKRIESKVKSGIDTVLGGSVHDPTIIDPPRYQQRFLKWMHSYFCSVPTRFETETYVLLMDQKLHSFAFE